jgi:putative tricarboxylic transport membrane protein
MTTGRNLRLGEAALGGGVLALGLFIAFETTRGVGPTNAVVGPALFPYLIAAGLIAVGASLLREAFAGRLLSGFGVMNSPQHDREPPARGRISACWS